MPAMRSHPSRASRQRGVTLIEAMVALMVMAFGMVALSGLMSNLRRSADLAKQRSEAMRMAQAELATLRAFSVLTRQASDAAGTQDYTNDITSLPAPRLETVADSNTTFALDRTVTPVAGSEPQARLVQVSVGWRDRSGELQAVALHTVIAGVDPAFTGAMSIAAPAGVIRQPGGRHPAIPLPAKDLGGELSAYKPVADGGTVWVFNNLTGVITGVCTGVTGPNSAITVSMLDGCTNNTVGYLVAGTVRFSGSNPANPTTPEATALPLTVRLALTGSGYSVSPAFECFSDAPATLPTTRTFVNYNCIVYPRAATTPRSWSGQVLLDLTGITLGTTAGSYRVCRYSADYNANGVISNDEHPATYVDVAVSLARQNFLVVAGPSNCPTAPAVNATEGVFADYSTRQLQPEP